MSVHCYNCGSPLAFDGKPSVKCPFCEAENAPPPQEVFVAVPVRAASEAPAMPANAADRRCPHCRKRLVTIVAHGVALSGCGSCGGIWVDNASARHVLSNPESIFVDLARRAAAGATGSRGKAEKPTCAECPAILDRSLVYGIELDTCTDHGTWFDAKELATLVHLLRHEPVATDLPNAPVVYCQTCNAPILNGRGNITDRGIACESCWRRETRDLVAAADAQMNDNAAVAGAAFGIAGLLLGALAGSSKS